MYKIVLFTLLSLSWLYQSQSFQFTERNKHFISVGWSVDSAVARLRICATTKLDRISRSRSDRFSSLIEEIDSFNFQDLYYSPFLSSNRVEDLSRHLKTNGGHYKVRSVGGYSQALRRKAIVADVRKTGQEDLLASLVESDLVGCVELTFSESVEKKDIIDFLSLAEDEIGDVIDVKQRKVWLVFLSADLVHDLMKNKLSTSGSAKILQIKTIDLINVPSALSTGAAKVETVQSKEKEMILVENSLRIDAVVSGGLSISRTSLLRLIEERKVTVNDKIVSSSATLVKEGQTIVVQPVGKVMIVEVSETNKGKFRIKCRRIKEAFAKS